MKLECREYGVIVPFEFIDNIQQKDTKYNKYGSIVNWERILKTVQTTTINVNDFKQIFKER